jgi:hypothetical protein
MERLEKQINFYQNKTVEQEKEIKMYQIKLRKFM